MTDSSTSIVLDEENAPCMIDALTVISKKADSKPFVDVSGVDVDNICDMISKGEASRTDFEEISNLNILWCGVLKFLAGSNLFHSGDDYASVSARLPQSTQRVLGAFFATFELLVDTQQNNVDYYLTSLKSNLLGKEVNNEDIIMMVRDYRTFYPFAYIFNRRTAKYPNSVIDIISPKLPLAAAVKEQELQRIHNSNSNNIRNSDDYQNSDEDDPMIDFYLPSISAPSVSPRKPAGAPDSPAAPETTTLTAADQNHNNSRNNNNNNKYSSSNKSKSEDEEDPFSQSQAEGSIINSYYNYQGWRGGGEDEDSEDDRNSVKPVAQFPIATKRTTRMKMAKTAVHQPPADELISNSGSSKYDGGGGGKKSRNTRSSSKSSSSSKSKYSSSTAVGKRENEGEVADVQDFDASSSDVSDDDDSAGGSDGDTSLGYAPSVLSLLGKTSPTHSENNNNNNNNNRNNNYENNNTSKNGWSSAITKTEKATSGRGWNDAKTSTAQLSGHNKYENSNNKNPLESSLESLNDDADAYIDGGYSSSRVNRFNKDKSGLEKDTLRNQKNPLDASLELDSKGSWNHKTESKSNNRKKGNSSLPSSRRGNLSDQSSELIEVMDFDLDISDSEDNHRGASQKGRNPHDEPITAPPSKYGNFSKNRNEPASKSPLDEYDHDDEEEDFAHDEDRREHSISMISDRPLDEKGRKHTAIPTQGVRSTSKTVTAKLPTASPAKKQRSALYMSDHSREEVEEEEEESVDDNTIKKATVPAAVSISASSGGSRLRRDASGRYNRDDSDSAKPDDSPLPSDHEDEQRYSVSKNSTRLATNQKEKDYSNPDDDRSGSIAPPSTTRIRLSTPPLSDPSVQNTRRAASPPKSPTATGMRKSVTFDDNSRTKSNAHIRENKNSMYPVDAARSHEQQQQQQQQQQQLDKEPYLVPPVHSSGSSSPNEQSMYSQQQQQQQGPGQGQGQGGPPPLSTSSSVDYYGRPVGAWQGDCSISGYATYNNQEMHEKKKATEREESEKEEEEEEEEEEDNTVFVENFPLPENVVLPPLSEYAKEAGVIFEGWISKKAPITGMWQKKYMVLSESSTQFCVLRIYSKVSVTSWGTVPLKLNTSVPILLIEAVLTPPAKEGKEFILKLVPKPESTVGKGSGGGKGWSLLRSSSNSLPQSSENSPGGGDNGSDDGENRSVAEGSVTSRQSMFEGIGKVKEFKFKADNAESRLLWVVMLKRALNAALDSL